MPTYRIEQYEIHTQAYNVTADTEADAISKLFRGEADPIDNSLEFVGIAHAEGMSPDGDWELFQALWDAGLIKAVDLVIPSIRSIRKVE